MIDASGICSLCGRDLAALGQYISFVHYRADCADPYVPCFADYCTNCGRTRPHGSDKSILADSDSCAVCGQRWETV